MSDPERRQNAMTVDCPKCGAFAGRRCVGKRGARKAAHLQRYEQFRCSGPAANVVAAPIPLAVVEKKVGFYHSDAWRDVRYKALKLHGAACQCCGARGRPGHPLHVDHIKPRSKFRELELELSNLQVLCEDCNLGKRAWDQTDWRAA